ncbi:MAG: hypothetical protein K0Q69_3775 [Devosia sp.]|jgi:hypothetical protein|nr:hypothetical protein [Devosia sp.]
MITLQKFGMVASNAGTAYVAGAPGSFLHANPGAGMAQRHIAPAVHAAWAVAAIAPQRKRRTAAATDASVDRGFI